MLQPTTLIIDGIWGRPWRWEKLRRRIDRTIGPTEIFWYDATGLKGLDVLGGRLMERVARAGGEVNVVAHSMGCLVARAARLHDPTFHFNRAVFMNGPLSGTFAAYCLPLPAIKQMRPGSEFLRSLDVVERDWKTPTMVTWCRGDVVILPNRSMRWERATCEHRFRSAGPRMAEMVASRTRFDHFVSRRQTGRYTGGMNRPLIGITTSYNDARTSYSLPYTYPDAIEKAGGLPILLPYRADASFAARYVDLCDGFVFSGGDDLDPSCYGEQWHEKAERIDPLRERFERALLAEVERRRAPVLGICLGSQLMNLHRGGSMHQFLPDSFDKIEHRNLKRNWIGRHDVELSSECKFGCAAGASKLVVNSSHKQAINKIGSGLKVIAKAPDGVIEGVEDPTFPFFMGVQWHAERLVDQPEQLRLFEMLVDSARSSK